MGPTITALTDLVNLTYEEILSLDYQPTRTDTSGNALPITKLNLGNVKTIQLLGKFISYTSEQFGSMELEDVMNLTVDDYRKFTLTKAYQYVQTNTSMSGKDPASTTGGAVASTTPQYSNLVAFQKSIKRDPLTYPTLKDEQFFDNWDCAFTAMTRMHGLENVLNPDFTPGGPDLMALFNEQQKFLYAVLNSV